MALFGSKKKTFTPIIEEQETKEEIKEIKEPILPQKDEIIKAPSDAALLTGCTNLEGKIEGCGSLVVRGKVNGDIEMDDIVIIDKSANVIGNIRAQKVKIEGQFRGDIFCEVVEITKYGKVEGNIQGNRAYIDGKFSGTTFTKEIIEILNFGKVEAVEFKSETIKIGGELKGKIVASKLLEVQKGGSIEGEIVTKGI
ncbi:MAG: polymer-forming cytoskeletal protein, partial [Epsilonproteobacteria bacterium]|nr:polymer-forming cytoskeletal protein [Campylobacterota bacterium]